ncbi:pyrroline-5-carboxylate reductase [Aureimonas endophytica]|uniref:Pyrroline-5-carboxylate reductase n=1 Tax=Aureimonas endophytica TaxID=2027858 RepID=A0A916ZZN1_9HYPH|nr:pyrroline-5-carboxylate reductase [Aureimonas endophytica]GGE19105.1 pyrroline-5-carboxylate reductase [Aureimonas endophytica]
MSPDLSAIGRLLLVGGGNMGGAMARGWLDAGLPQGALHLLDPRPGPAMRDLVEAGRLTHSTGVPSATFDVVLLAVKPQMMAEVLPGLRPVLKPGSLVISVAAGTTTATIAEGLGAAAIVRAMPNTPALIGRGITGCFAAPGVGEEARRAAEALLSASGPVVWVATEAEIDLVTAVSGSGPAYVFLLAEALAAAGAEAGLDPDLAMTLARHTVAGAGELMLRSDEAPAQLRRNVTSPNGTTQAALDVLMAEDGLAPLLRRAVASAARRAAELSEPAK